MLEQHQVCGIRARGHVFAWQARPGQDVDIAAQNTHRGDGQSEIGTARLLQSQTEHPLSLHGRDPESVRADDVLEVDEDRSTGHWHRPTLAPSVDRCRPR